LAIRLFFDRQRRFDADAASRMGRVADDPGLTDDRRMNALLGAVGEHLRAGGISAPCRRGATGPSVSWTGRGSWDLNA
jgi:hypothetical protein